jgi:hypothetical protein
MTGHNADVRCDHKAVLWVQKEVYLGRSLPRRPPNSVRMDCVMSVRNRLLRPDKDENTCTQCNGGGDDGMVSRGAHSGGGDDE